MLPEMSARETHDNDSFKRHRKFSNDNSEEYNEAHSFKTKMSGETHYAGGETLYTRNKQNQNWHNDDGSRFRQWNSPRQGKFQDKSVINKPKKDNFSEGSFEEIPSPNKPRNYTISIAVPASILEETCIKDELRTYVVGQIARAANIYSIDEIVVYDDRSRKRKFASVTSSNTKDCLEMMRMLLEYQECPQYLRKYLFPFHSYLRMVGVLNALNSPHHLLSHQWCEYREGVVLEKGSKCESYVDVGLGVDVEIQQKLEPGLRVTVKMPPEAQVMRKPYGVVVSPDEPRLTAGYYWGYTVRVAESLSEVVAGSRFPDGYDLLIGTSDKGDDVRKTEYPTFSHALVVFGGVEGLEAAIDADNKLEASEPLQLFDYYNNTCPLQQTRTIRTEEAVLISLCVLQDKLVPKGKL
ncbi:putative methyltransferase C9orf114 isoform X1 [Procambarus clarkii]|uniref:putative methyltransferase C9orf114 isoform X1 n=2 Tax=Procambarus clarkii TaxID=6728 RepID=UPI0037441F31